jgi:hypothetical protein
MLMLHPGAVNGPNPDWRGPLDRPLRVLIDGKPVAVDRVWVPTAGQPGGNYALRRGPLRRWACLGPTPQTHISIAVFE